MTLWLFRDAADPQHQIGQPLGGVERRRRLWRRPPWRRAGAASAASAAISAASRSGVKSACVDADRAAGLHQHAGIGELVLVERMRQRHQDRRAGRSPASSATVEAPERDTTRCARRHARRQIGEERRDLGRDLKPRVGVAHARRNPRRAPAARWRAAPAARGSSCSIAGGTMSAITRAPWLPPNTRRRSGPSASSARIGRRRGGDHRRPHRIAGVRRLGGERRLAVEHAGKAGGDGA